MEHWWNGRKSDMLGKKNLPQCHSVHHKSHTDCPGIKHGLPQKHIKRIRVCKRLQNKY
jgi:hypothetical protein